MCGNAHIHFWNSKYMERLIIGSKQLPAQTLCMYQSTYVRTLAFAYITVLTQIRTDRSVGPDLSPNRLTL